MNSLEKRLEAHINEEKKDIVEIHETLKVMKENHLAHIQSSVAEITTDIAVLKSEGTWHKWGILAILGTLITSLVVRAIF